MGDARALNLSTSSKVGISDRNAYPMWFAVSCAFAALDLFLKRMRVLDLEHGRWTSVAELMLKGSAQLLGLLVEDAQKEGKEVILNLKKAEFEIDELKKRRTEDAKANEKVVAIFAAHEQRWLAERKSLKHQNKVLAKVMQTLKMKNEEDASSFNRKLEEKDQILLARDEALEVESKRRKELDEKLQVAEQVIEELREKAKKEAQDYAAELWKHKTAFVELVSSHRHTEAELSRAIREVEVVKQELEEVFERKEEVVAMVDSLSGEVIKLQKESEQKDKILSAMLRKSKLDIAEKQMLLKEVKISKAKKKQAELEMDRWKNMWESRHKKGPKDLRNIEEGCSQNQRPEMRVESNGHNPQNLLAEYLEAESRKEHDSLAFKNESSSLTAIEFLDRHTTNENNESGIIVNDFQRFEELVRVETEKCVMILEQRHYAEMEAFTEQMCQKDEKLEAFRWKILSMELESKRLQSYIEGLDGNLSHFREENLKLETLLLDKEKELKSLKEQLNFYVQQLQKRTYNKYLNLETCRPPNRMSEIKNAKARPRHDEEVSRIKPVTDTQMAPQKKPEEDRQNANQDTTLIILEAEKDTETSLPSQNNQFKDTCSNEMYLEQYKIQGDLIMDEQKSIMVMSTPATDEIEEDKELSMDQGSSIESIKLNRKEDTRGDISSSLIVRKDSTWKMDIHALGVAYKIKRLKQQLNALEKLAGSQETKQSTTMNDASTPEDSSEGKNVENRLQMKGLLQVKSLLNKQLKRYQSLEEKTDDLCRRMQESSRSGSRREVQSGKTKESTRALERYLEETFHLQRYMVSTGQKLIEIQSKISSTLSFANLGETVGFNMGHFADFVRSLFTDVQRGLEMRIARIIGDLEGTLACDGILHW